MNFFTKILGTKKILKPTDGIYRGQKWKEPCSLCRSKNVPAVFPHKMMTEAIAWVRNGGRLTQCSICGWWRGLH